MKKMFLAILLIPAMLIADDHDSADHDPGSAEHGAEEQAEIRTVSPQHHQVHTEIVINAPPEVVWRVLTDFENMPDWSSAFQGITGEFRHGNQVKTHYKAGGQDVHTDHVLIIEPGKSFGWSDEIAPGMTDNHRHTVEALPDGGTRFVHTDGFKSTQEGAPTKIYAEQTLLLYTIFNKELKAEAERQAKQDK